MNNIKKWLTLNFVEVIISSAGFDQQLDPVAYDFWTLLSILSSSSRFFWGNNVVQTDGLLLVKHLLTQQTPFLPIQATQKDCTLDHQWCVQRVFGWFVSSYQLHSCRWIMKQILQLCSGMVTWGTHLKLKAVNKTSAGQRGQCIEHVWTLNLPDLLAWNQIESLPKAEGLQPKLWHTKDALPKQSQT